MEYLVIFVAVALTYPSGGSILHLAEHFVPKNYGVFTHTLHIVAETTPGNFSVVKVITFTTPNCPNITPLTALTGDERCVNIGAIQTYEFSTSPSILKDAQWTIDWGDLSIYSFNSATNGDIPSPFPSHQYLRDDSCYFKVSLKIANAEGCATIGLLSKNEFAKVHGRDTEDDGRGSQLLVDDADDSPDTIKVCEGTIHYYPPGRWSMGL